MAKINDITTNFLLEISSKALSRHLKEIAYKMTTVRDENLALCVKQFKDVEDAVAFMVTNGAGNSVSGNYAVAQDALRRAVELTKRSEKLYTIHNSLEADSEHAIRLTVEQASEFGL